MHPEAADPFARDLLDWYERHRRRHLLRPDGYTATAWIHPDDPGEIGLSTLARKALSLAASRQIGLPWLR